MYPNMINLPDLGQQQGSTLLPSEDSLTEHYPTIGTHSLADGFNRSQDFVSGIVV